MYRVKLSGIYLIIHKPTEQYYIGKSTSIFDRWFCHYTDLKLNRHHSKRFQELFNNDSNISNYTFNVLEYISITEFKKSSQKKGKELKNEFNKLLLRKEKEWMKLYSKNFCLNSDNKNFS